LDVSTLDGRVGDLQAQSEEEVFEEFAAHVTGEDGLSDGHRAVLEEAFERLREEERGA
jgi:exonuclease SbcD